jgi:prepilin-type N-terminal cleavage/methylation domain-containing protein
MSHLVCRHDGRRGFTMIELLTVIGIIVVLMAILIPVISTVRRIAQNTDTTHLLTKIATACNNYYTDFRGYPGPLPDTAVHGYNVALINDPQPPAASVGFSAALTSPIVYNNVTPGATFTDVTSTQNLILGLCGGLTVNPAVVATGTPYFDISLIPKGPRILNPLAAQQMPSYINPGQNDLATDGVGNYNSVALMGTNPQAPPQWAALGAYAIPEFIDHYSQPNAIIYLRARPGAQSACDVPAANGATGSQYYSAEMAPYAPNFYNQVDRYNNFTTYYTAYSIASVYGASFFANQSLDNGTNTVPRAKDSFILISAGYDGLYGTKDDIVYPPQ